MEMMVHQQNYLDNVKETVIMIPTVRDPLFATKEKAMSWYQAVKEVGYQTSTIVLILILNITMKINIHSSKTQSQTHSPKVVHTPWM